MRKSAARGFYLAVFALLGSTAHGATPSKSKTPPANVCEVSHNGSSVCRSIDQSPKYTVQFEPGAIVSDACASYSTLEGLNEAIHPYLKAITQETDFFSHWRLSLYNKKCPFWSDENGMCGNIACAVNTLDNEEDIPLVWRAKELGKLEGPTASHPGKKLQKEKKKRPLQGNLGENVDESCVVEYDDECDERDYCVPDDESATAKGDYVSLVDNPERFTGYAGVGAQQVWQAIYRENCFSKPSKKSQAPAFQPFSGLGSQEQLDAANQLRNVMQQQALQQNVKSAIAQGTAAARLDPIEFDDTCIEKRVFHRVVSGMHASISTHLCAEYLNQTTGQWAPNLQCYEERLHHYPDRISNLYFNYALVLRAVGKIKRHVSDYSFCSEDPEQDQRTKNMVLRLASAVPSGPEIFDETVMFQDPDSQLLKEDFRNRFRNISRIMDCVGCDKCRLWGKLQTNGYGTALKVLFEFDEHDSSRDPPLRRTELVALLNTMDRLSHSLANIQTFREMIEQRDGIARAPVPSTQLTKEVLKTKAALEADAKSDAVVDDGLPDGFPRRKKHRSEMTVWEDVCEETSLVFRALIWVLKSWINFPAKALKIAIIETGRLWDFWMGLPVRPRSWEFYLPTRDEI